MPLDRNQVFGVTGTHLTLDIARNDLLFKVKVWREQNFINLSINTQFSSVNLHFVFWPEVYKKRNLRDMNISDYLT